MIYKIIHLGGEVLRVDSSVPNYTQTIDQFGRILKLEDKNGKILYKSKAYQDLELSDKYSNEFEKFPTEWYKDEDSKFILTRSNFRVRHRWGKIEPHYYPEYKCEKCDYTKGQIHLIKGHLRQSHQLYQKPPAPPPKCHACGYKYKVGLKHLGYPGIVKAKEKHYAKCKSRLERLRKYEPSSDYTPEGGYIDYDAEFDTTQLEIYDRILLEESFSRKFVSEKHIYSECQSQYIDKYTTAYRSEIVQAIMGHDG